MLHFFAPKTQIKYYGFKPVPIEAFEVIGIGQINPYCNIEFDNEIFVTVVDIVENARGYDEKEGLILSEYFTVRRCPQCHRIKLIPTKIRLNTIDTNQYCAKYKNDVGTYVRAYCNFCSSCFEFDIKENDLWLKETKKIKEKNLITGAWEKYDIER